MKTMLQNTLGTLVLLILVTVMMVAPPAALAKMQMSNGNGNNGGNGSEGDPLDSNDTGGGDGSGGDIVHQRRIAPPGSHDVIFDIQASGKRLILRVEFLGDVPVFRLEIISGRELRVEANHVH